MINVGKKAIIDVLQAPGLFAFILHLSFYQIFKYDIFKVYFLLRLF